MNKYASMGLYLYGEKHSKYIMENSKILKLSLMELYKPYIMEHSGRYDYEKYMNDLRFLKDSFLSEYLRG